MGVSGLLPVLKSIQEPTTLERFRGKTLAIDTYAWLHKASFTCAEDLVLEKPTRAYINYFKKKLDMLRYFNITPYFVFDGDYLPSKGATEKERESRREEYKKLATEAKNSGNKKLAFNYYQKACDISPEMAKSLINELKLKHIKYVVAPYEADSQMVMLEKLGLVEGIISEDSDLLIFGCQTLITKLDDKGQCIEIKRNNFKNCKGSHISTFDDGQLLLMAAISGCDYTKGIPGIGMQKAISLVKYYKTYERVMMSIKVEGKSIPPTFDEEYKRAKIAFRHQIVFNPIEQVAQHLNTLTEEVTSAYTQEYIHSCTGFLLDQEIHKKIATGELDPFSKNVLISWEAKVNSPANRSNSLPVQSNAKFNNTILRRSKTDNSIPARKLEAEPVTRKRKSTMKIDQFGQFIKKKQLSSLSNQIETKGDRKCELSPISKRQKLLNSNEIGVGTISKFFSHKKELSKEAKDKEFPATSSDIEDITEEDFNDINMKLNRKLDGTAQKRNTDSSDVNLTESEDDTERNVNSNILHSESDMDDIIDSSEISQSTITPDKTFSRQTPTSLVMEGSSISSGISTDPGEVNTECYIEDEKNEGEVSRFDDGNEEDAIVDKNNLLAEIYSFNHNSKLKKLPNPGVGLPTASSWSASLLGGNKDRSNSSEVGNAFSPEKWGRNFGGSCVGMSKVHRPSPLQNRVPLREVTENANRRNIVTKETAKEGSKTQQRRKNTVTRPSLSSFRYVSK